MYGGAGDDKLYTSGGFNYMNGGADFDICDDDDDHQELCEAVDTD